MEIHILIVYFEDYYILKFHIYLEIKSLVVFSYCTKILNKMKIHSDRIHVKILYNIIVLDI